MAHHSTRPTNRPDYRPNPDSAALEGQAIRRAAENGPSRPIMTAEEARARHNAESERSGQVYEYMIKMSLQS